MGLAGWDASSGLVKPGDKTAEYLAPEAASLRLLFAPVLARALPGMRHHSIAVLTKGCNCDCVTWCAESVCSKFVLCAKWSLYFTELYFDMYVVLYVGTQSLTEPCKSDPAYTGQTSCVST